MKTRDNETTTTPIRSSKKYFFVFILYILFLSDFICRIGVNTLYPAIQKDLSLTDTQIGLLGSAVMLTMSICVLPFSYIADKFSKKKSISIMTIFWSLSTLLTGFAHSFPTVFLGRASVGIGNSAYAPTSVSIITNWFDPKQWGKVIGVYNTAMTLGAAAGAVVCGTLAQVTGWRNTLFIVGGVSLLFSLMTIFLPDERKAVSAAAKKEQKKKVTLKETCKILIQNRTLMMMCIGAGFMALVNNALSGFLSIFYVRELGMSLIQVGSIMGLSGVIGAIAYPIGGFTLDKLYAKDKRVRLWLPAISMLITGGCYVVAFVGKSWIMVMVASFFYGFVATSLHTASQELVPSWNKSVSYGVYVTITKIFGIIGPTLAGVLSGIFGLVPTLAGIQIGTVIMAIFLFIASRTYLRDYNQARELEKAVEAK